MATTTEASPPTSRHRWLALSVVLVAAFMDLMDATIVNIALPRIQTDLDAGYAQAQWILAGYSLTFALALITGGRLGDVYGRKRIFLIGVVGFVVASAVCGAASTPGLLIGARLAQGIFAAIMVPQVMSVILIMFDGRERVRAFGLYAAVLSLANVAGPLVGALLAQYDVLGLGWRAIFFVNVPIGVLAFVFGLLFMPESKADHPLRLDLAGVAVVSLASFALMYPVVQGREAGWPMWMVIVLIAAVPLFVLFAIMQRRRDRADGSALVPPVLFRYRSFAIGLVSLLILFSGLASLFLVLTYDLQIGQGWSPMVTALTGIGWPVGIMLTSGIAQQKAATHGRRLIVIGLMILVVGMIVLIALLDAAGPDVTFWHVALPVLGMGTGMGLCVSILANVVLADVPLHAAGAGSGVTNAVIQLGTAVGVAIIGVIFFGLTAGRADTHAQAVTAQLEQRLGQAGITGTAASEVVAGFRQCYQDKESSPDPAAVPASCRAVTADPRAAGPVQEAMMTARENNFAGTASSSLWYNAGVFALALLLTPFLPRGTRRFDQPEAPAASPQPATSG
ncbi:MFS transporter [Kibdelosporangium aridum]|uniref:MFS transporter n=1 Tax=Kibdelosporangium aridum TaxID=2030 RepID=A0A428Z0X3_KIBAR|nr:MFS transporter [Kibdelosporangium aridum]RSM78121.1 MFS transporter [Kibdelosporangium aridum]